MFSKLHKGHIISLQLFKTYVNVSTTQNSKYKPKERLKVREKVKRKRICA